MIISGRIREIIFTPNGLIWSSPAPANCLSGHIVSLSGSLGGAILVRTGIASISELFFIGFAYCKFLNITITPVAALTNLPLTNSNATAYNVYARDLGKLMQYVYIYIEWRLSIHDTL